MPAKLEIRAASSEESQDLFDAFYSRAADSEPQQLTFHATTARGEAVGAGLPEVTSLILSLGSAGAFVALAEVLKAYFAKRPAGTLVFTARRGKTVVRVTAQDCDAGAVAKALGSLLPAGK